MVGVKLCESCLHRWVHGSKSWEADVIGLTGVRLIFAEEISVIIYELLFQISEFEEQKCAI